MPANILNSVNSILECLRSMNSSISIIIEIIKEENKQEKKFLFETAQKDYNIKRECLSKYKSLSRKFSNRNLKIKNIQKLQIGVELNITKYYEIQERLHNYIKAYAYELDNIKVPFIGKKVVADLKYKFEQDKRKKQYREGMKKIENKYREEIKERDEKIRKERKERDEKIRKEDEMERRKIAAVVAMTAIGAAVTKTKTYKKTIRRMLEKIRRTKKKNQTYSTME